MGGAGGRTRASSGEDGSEEADKFPAWMRGVAWRILCLLPWGVARTTLGGLSASERWGGLLSVGGVGGDLLGRSSGGDLKMSAVPFGTAVKGL